ncbi:MAG: 2-oxoacid:acceptor oxidoreductase family protein [Candidatus Omnitrophota bacterium]|nr:MAG: 2-oxoacid:acceptor oxidoreductase family protein [Candidatus Omnitrophota bacterium]
MKKLTHEEIICAGFGGQGIVLMGKFLAEAGMKNGYNITWLPSYGAEVRGGTAHSMVHISTQKIASPVISKPTTCIAMNEPSLVKFIDRIKKGGLLIVNTSMVNNVPEKKGIKIVKLPLTRIASELGNVKVANMIAIGAFIGLRKILSLKDIQEALDKVLPSKKDLISINKKAIELGYKLVS